MNTNSNNTRALLSYKEVFADCRIDFSGDISGQCINLAVSSVPLVSFFLKFLELKPSLVVKPSLLPHPKYGMIYPFLSDTHHH